MIKTELDSMPAELDEQNRKIMQLEIEETALKKETDNLSKGTVWSTYRRNWQSLVMILIKKAQWDNEKSLLKVSETS